MQKKVEGVSKSARPSERVTDGMRLHGPTSVYLLGRLRSWPWVATATRQHTARMPLGTSAQVRPMAHYGPGAVQWTRCWQACSWAELEAQRRETIYLEPTDYRFGPRANAPRVRRQCDPKCSLRRDVRLAGARIVSIDCLAG